MKPFNSKKLSVRKTLKGNISKINVNAFIGVPFPEQYNTKPSDFPPTQRSDEIHKVTINGIDGCICIKCKVFVPYAEPNQEDGTMICYSCRSQWS